MQNTGAGRRDFRRIRQNKWTFQRSSWELVQSLADKSDFNKRTEMLSAMLLSPFGADDLLEEGTLLSDLLGKTDSIDCVDWVEVEAESSCEEGSTSLRGGRGAATRIIPLIRFHVLVKDLSLSGVSD